jgi:hypothetical protein
MVTWVSYRKPQAGEVAAEDHKEEVIKGEVMQEGDKGQQESTALVHPPEMPIVIDEAAVEDILGVSQRAFFLDVISSRSRHRGADNHSPNASGIQDWRVKIQTHW